MEPTHQNKWFLAALCVWPIVATMLVVLLKTPYLLTSGVLYFGIPALYLAWKYPKYILKISIISSIIVVIGIPFEYIVEMNREYVVPVSVLGNFRILQYITLDVLLWGFMWIFFTLIFYETASNHGKNMGFVTPQFKNLAIIATLFLGLFLMLYFTNPDLLKIPYFYLLFGLFAMVVPVFSITYKFPVLRKKFFFISTYFTFVYFLHELSSLYLGQWFFPTTSRVLGHVNIGNLTFAHEEWIFYILISAPAILAYYEYFDDDRK